MSISICFSAIRSWNLWNRQKVHKTPI